ncbi:DUF4334 domain-containing protein [Puerhibacterium puerhi]|uniref:DUF4334 domain-containing protein n=1 Tax=Puerhibacterium puerhi TaxID=2692623 RepID=UPI001358DCE8|nr:DUF4334 domain-containing protein [Puerhibacterium puerhi]
MAAGPSPAPHTPAARLAELRRTGATTPAALAFYDSLAPVTLEQLRGTWRGEDLRTDHPLDGVLGRLGWYGKRFDGEDAHPLLFEDGTGGVVAIDPRYVPLTVVRRWPRVLGHPAAVRAFRALLPLLRARRPKARLVMAEYRSVATATMVYDRLPVFDAFRWVDDRTVLGAMWMRGMPGTYFFVLRRADA